ncbi:glycosyltransferase family 1 protein [Xanthomonas sp. WHRI 1810A]|uniref:glycosyltransferase family 4 protein n=1 Tax=Xanthomonas sp. WHRI 1810A TaxID=3161565 RepID=UPI0032E8D5D3
MKIAYDYQTFTQQTYGGISRYFVRLAQQLTADQQQVKIFAPFHRNRYVDELPAGVFEGRQLETFPPRTARLFSLYNRVTSNGLINRWAPDVIHETYYSAKPSGSTKLPRVTTVHDMIHERYPESFSVLDGSSKLKRISLARADVVICISENTKRDLIELFNTPEDKICVIHHGVDHIEAQPKVAPADGVRPYLLYVGHRPGYKNFARLIGAVASSDRLRNDFDVVAFGGGAFSRDELQLFSDSGLRDGQVRQLGGSDDVLGRLYDGAKAFIYPSIYEGFGLPPLEAMARHCPVISSNTSSMPEVIGDAAAFFDPTDQDALRDVLETELYSDTRLQDLVNKGVERLKQFSWEKCARQTLQAYHKAAS